MSRAFGDFLRNLIDYGLEYFELYYGVYRAKVVDNEDPDGQGRIKVQVPMLNMPDEAPLPHWAYPMISGYPTGSGKGDYKVPDVDDYVFVSFEGGRAHSPLYLSGGWFGKGDKPEEFETPEDRGFKTTSGHVFRTRDAEGNESILLRHMKNSELAIDKDGSVFLKTEKGDELVMDATGDTYLKHNSGSQILMDKSGSKLEASTSQGTKLSFEGPNATVESAAVVTLECTRLVLNGKTSIELGSGAVHPLIKGDVFVSWLGAFVAWAAAHVHVPLTPPIAPPPPPPIPTFLSLISKTK